MPYGKRVLFVQPDTDLFYSAKEAEQVVNLLDANLLSGNVDINDLINRVRQYQPQLIIFSSHGTQEGILLSDGIIGAEELAPILGTSTVECVYLNTCNSVKTALKIHGVLPVDFIFTLSGVPDRNAFITMATFAYHLSQGCSYGSAWFESRGGATSDFMLLPNIVLFTKNSGSNVKTNNDNEKPTKNDNGNGRLDNIHDEVVQLGYLIYGNEKWQLPGLVNSVNSLQRDVSFIKTAVLLIVLLTFLVIVGGIWLVLSI